MIGLGPSLFTSGGSGRQVYDDAELRGRVVTAEDDIVDLDGRLDTAEIDIGTLKSGKATAASVTAVSNRVTTLETRLVGTVTKAVRQDGSGDFVTVTDALTWFRSQDRRSGARGVIDVSGTYLEDLPDPDEGADENWLTVRGSYEADRVATGATTVAQLVNTTDCFLVTVPLASADVAGLTIGDVVYLHFGTLTGGTDAQARMTGTATVYSKAATSVVVVIRGRAPVSVAGLRLVRPSAQIVLATKAATFVGGRAWRPQRIVIRPNTAPEIRATFNLVALYSGAQMSTVEPDEANGTAVPSLLLCNGNAGLVMSAADTRFVGSVAACNCRYQGIFFEGFLLPSVVVANGNGGDSLSMAGPGATFDIRKRGADMKSLILGNVGCGIATLTLAKAFARGDYLICKGHAFVDFYSANDGHLVTAGLTASTYSPAAGTAGNGNALNTVLS